MDNRSLDAQLTANANALEWGRLYLRGKELEDFRTKLITNRLKLKRLKYANNVNPAAAIFGESQVGKSYMVDCLLTSETQVLNIYNGKGESIGFLESVNPLGGGQESTSLISRFTTGKVWIDDEYPIRAAMLKPVDVIIVLLDAYYNDLNGCDFPKSPRIKEEIENLRKRYQSVPPQQKIITEDEIYELREYLNSELVSKGEAFRESLFDNKYFEQLALLIRSIDDTQWADVFGFLWNKDAILTEVFRKLISTLKKMGYSSVVYLKQEAVLRKYGTLLDVDRLYELLDISEVKNEDGKIRRVNRASQPVIEVLTEDGRKLNDIRKGEFCALAMELAFSIVNPESDNAEFLKEKPFLEKSDILDFPGARSRKLIKAENLSRTEACEMILRGKVAYLFNKYSQQYLITNLLFCHHDIKSEVSTLSSLLQGWVDNTVGDTPDKREEFMRVAEISPLFVIGTKFNIDLEKTPDDSKGDDESKYKVKEYRWSKRFGNLESLVAPSVSNNWLNQWTPGREFTNTYLLRSFEFSCQRGIYEGYQEKDADGNWQLARDGNGRLKGETSLTDEYKKFIPQLKDTFLKNDFVRHHFDSPEKSWDEAVSVRKDGSEWIIENLTVSSRKMSDSRDKQFSRICGETFEVLVNQLCELYHDDNSDLELQKQIQTAGAISLTFDVLFGKDKYFFSDFISSMVVDEEHLHDIVMDIINNMRVVEETDLSSLFAIRAHANIDNNLPYEENRNRLMTTYKCGSEEELKESLKKYSVSVEDIINPPRVMNFSRLIADAVEKNWTEMRLSLDRYKDFIARGLGEKELKSLLDNTKVLYTDKLRISDRIAKTIHPFVSAATSVDDMADMLADICAEMINSFVNTMGASYYDEELWNNIKSTIKHNAFDVAVLPDGGGHVEFDKEAIVKDLPDVFDTFDNVDQILNEVPVNKTKLRNFSNYQEYYKWTELMKVSFLATQGIPKYNVDMNNALRAVLVKYIIERPEIADLVTNNKKLKSLKTASVAQDEGTVKIES